MKKVTEKMTYRCDYCGKTETFVNHDLYRSPAGWYSLAGRKNDDDEKPEVEHLCSHCVEMLHCALGHRRKQVGSQRSWR